MLFLFYIACVAHDGGCAIMRYNRIFFIGAAALLTFLISACGSKGPAGTESGAGAKDAIVLKAGFSTSAADPRVVATQLFKEEVESATDGRITVQIHPDGELGASLRYLSQRFSMPYPELKAILTDIGTEE